uniref:Uncharacterized protein n=1 Tax=Tanacetum cinerariifolium TaxID=118510 RepID=A0A6L2KH67_TANCI|nr:hypothetical protein [Tanacetum cinerariifolium]
MMIVYCQKYADEHRDFALRVNTLVGQMNEACLDRISFVHELQSVAGATVPVKTVLLLEKMMDKKGNMEWYQKEETIDRRLLITELRCNVDSSDWIDVLSYFCQKAAAEDRRFATQLNTLHEEMANVCEKRMNLAYEPRSVKGTIVAGKAAEFMTDTLRKDDAEMA